MRTKNDAAVAVGFGCLRVRLCERSPELAAGCCVVHPPSAKPAQLMAVPANLSTFRVVTERDVASEEAPLQRPAARRQRLARAWCIEVDQAGLASVHPPGVDRCVMAVLQATVRSGIFRDGGEVSAGWVLLCLPSRHLEHRCFELYAW